MKDEDYIHPGWALTFAISVAVFTWGTTYKVADNSWRKEAIQHNFAQYNSKSGDWEWKSNEWTNRMETVTNVVHETNYITSIQFDYRKPSLVLKGMRTLDTNVVWVRLGETNYVKVELDPVWIYYTYTNN